MDFPYTVYILLCADGHKYVGCTNDLDERLRRHQAGAVHYTSDKLPVQCIASFGFLDKYKAFAFEKYLKSASGRAFMSKRLIQWLRLAKAGVVPPLSNDLRSLASARQSPFTLRCPPQPCFGAASGTCTKAFRRWRADAAPLLPANKYFPITKPPLHAYQVLRVVAWEQMKKPRCT